MYELDELDTYNGDAGHDMWVDFTTHEYTGKLAEYFDDTDKVDFEPDQKDSEVEKFIDNHDDWV